MLRSLDLRKEPSVRQSETILRRISEELTARGARVDRSGTGAVGGLRFRMPRPWEAPHLGILLAITSGRTVITAGSGGPWRVRYELSFAALRWLTIALTAVLITLVLTGDLAWDRSRLLGALVLLWTVLYGAPYVLASAQFERIIRSSAAEILERRHRARAVTTESESPIDDSPDTATPADPKPSLQDPPPKDPGPTS
jgi:hypothetical protein